MAYDWRNWLATSERDLAIAQSLISGGFFEGAVFYSHEAAQKALKAVWIAASRTAPPKTRNLVELACSVQAPATVVTVCSLLNPHYLASRDPGVAGGNPANNYTAQSAVVLVAHAAEVFEWVLKPISVLKAEAVAEQAATLEAADGFARRCRDELSATQVYLYGSRARDDWHLGSDCDVLVLSDRFEGLKRWESWLLIEPRWSGPVSIEPVGLTPAGFEAAKGKRGLVDMALADGVIPLLPER